MPSDLNFRITIATDIAVSPVTKTLFVPYYISNASNLTDSVIAEYIGAVGYSFIVAGIASGLCYGITRSHAYDRAHLRRGLKVRACGKEAENKYWRCICSFVHTIVHGKH